jgi:DNA-binding GntR family transcriptional regulator
VKPKEFTKPSSVVEQIHRSLSEAILNHELKPGTALTEAQLQEWFGVSRAPIREAIRLLESEGLVVVNAFKKKYVRKYSKEEMREMYSVLGCLEGFAANLATSRITNEQIDFLEKNLEQMKEEYSKGNLDSCSQLNFEFHGTITRVAGNTVLKKNISNIVRGPGCYRLTRTFYQDPVLVLAYITDHARILTAFKERDPERVEKCVRDHFSNIGYNLSKK